MCRWRRHLLVNAPRVASFIAAVTDWEEFAASVATEVLHKKRPKLTPILDNEAIFGAYMNPKWPEKLASTDSVYAKARIARDDPDRSSTRCASHLPCNKPEDRSRPMNLTVLGATGPTGTQLVEQALAAGHHVTALARSPEKLTITNPNLHVVQGDATDRAAVSQAMKGADAVISTLGAKGSVIAAAARAIVAVAKQEGPQRIVMLSSFAVARDRLKAASKLLTGMAMGAQIKDKTAGEEALRASGLDWTIVYPTRLTNGPKTEPTVVPETTKVGMSHTVSRADVVSFLLQAATDGLYSRRAVIITG